MITLQIQGLYTSIASSVIIIPPIIVITTIFAKSRHHVYEPPNNTRTIKRGRNMPHWCIYVAWCLVFLCIASGSFFTILYALQWGKTKSEAWLGAFFLSFFQSVCVIQPIKVCSLRKCTMFET